MAWTKVSMTRGQNTLSMDIEVEVAASGGALEAVPLAAILVLAPSADELAEHQALLGGLDKAVKGSCVWRNYADA